MKLVNPKHLINATRYSLAGLKRAWNNEQAFRHEVLLLPVLLLLLALIRPGMVWFALLVGAWLLVMAIELLNTAVEEVFNFVSPDYSESAKNGKDVASAAIFITLCLNAVLWVCMLADRFF